MKEKVNQLRHTYTCSHIKSPLKTEHSCLTFNYLEIPNQNLPKSDKDLGLRGLGKLSE